MASFTETELQGWRRNAAHYDALCLPATSQAFQPVLDALGDIRKRAVLEMACGTGHLARLLSVKGAHVTAIDFAPEMIELARREAPAATFKEADCERLPFAEASFEGVACCFGALHFERPDAVFSQAYRVLKPGGKFVFTIWRGPEDGGEFLGMILGVYQLHADMNVNLPAGPAMFDLADKARTTERLTRIGFEDTVIRDFDVVWSAPNPRGVSEIVELGMVRTRMILDLQTPQRRKAILQAIEHRARQHSGEGPFQMKSGVRLFSAMKPR